MINTAKQLYEELSRDYKPNIKRPELGEFCTLRYFGTEETVEFSIGWYDKFIVKFRPQTVGVKYTKIDSSTKESKTVSKSFSLEQENLLDTILALYVK